MSRGSKDPHSTPSTNQSSAEILVFHTNDQIRVISNRVRTDPALNTIREMRSNTPKGDPPGFARPTSASRVSNFRATVGTGLPRPNSSLRESRVRRVNQIRTANIVAPATASLENH